ncbi:hypothetical protein HPB50_013323 [Hyalomma asiaticum]|uniref:Uncharacterized protein n=1 Tax=Hyalomma asiaticum TaxID=266040 RepID=A0ACB7TJD0_HYAAI|nr:hypothetical protein HPB50_013323 [Hyalomma asiaticum]
MRKRAAAPNFIRPRFRADRAAVDGSGAAWLTPLLLLLLHTSARELCRVPVPAWNLVRAREESPRMRSGWRTARAALSSRIQGPPLACTSPKNYTLP